MASVLAMLAVLTLGPAVSSAATAPTTTAAVAAGPPYRLVATRKAAIVKGLLKLARSSGLSDPKRCYAVYVARHNKRWGTITYSQWAWSHKAYDGSGPCHPGEGGVSLARKGRTVWRWTGAYTGGGDVRSECIARARAKKAPVAVAKDFCAGW